MSSWPRTPSTALKRAARAPVPRRRLFLSLLWLGTTMYVAHATLARAQPPDGVLGAALEAMPDLILSSLLTGASLGAVAGSRLRGPARRLLAGLAIGIAFGLLAAFAMRMVYGTEQPITVLAITVGLTTVVGGTFAITPRRDRRRRPVGDDLGGLPGSDVPSLASRPWRRQLPRGHPAASRPYGSGRAVRASETAR